MRHRLAFTTALAGMTVLVSVTTAKAASEQQARPNAVAISADSGSFTITARYVGPKGLSPDATGVTSGVITCTAHVDDVHKSTTPGPTLGNPNVHARVSCTGYVTSISISVGIYRNNVLVGKSGPVVNYGKNLNEDTANGTRASGDYYGRIGGYVVFPTNYRPASGDVAANGPITHLEYGACAGAVPRGTGTSALPDAVREPDLVRPSC